MEYACYSSIYDINLLAWRREVFPYQVINLELSIEHGLVFAFRYILSGIICSSHAKRSAGYHKKSSKNWGMK